MDGEVKVISLKPGLDLKRVSDPNKIFCNHPNVIVDEENRVIECDKCGIVMDAFDYLKTVALKESIAFDRYNLLIQENAKLEKRYSNLTKEVERLNRIKKQI